MRSPFAIAPLALVLTLVGPTPTEANHAVSAFTASVVHAVSAQAFAWMPVPTAAASKNPLVGQEAKNETDTAATSQR